MIETSIQDKKENEDFIYSIGGMVLHLVLGEERLVVDS